MKWYFNGLPIEKNPNMNDVITEKRGKKIHLLMIESVAAHHIGNYTCNSANHAGVVEFSAELNVNGWCEKY